MRRVALLVSLLALAALAVPIPAAAQDVLAAQGVEGVIVTFSDGSTSGHAAVEAAAGSDGELRKIGDETVAFDVADPQATIDRLAAVDGIDVVEPDWPVAALLDPPDDSHFDLLWGLHNTGQSGGTVDVDIDALEAWSQLSTRILPSPGSAGPLGDDVVVAVTDTGIDASHPDLAERMYSGPGPQSWFNCPAGSFGYDYVDDECSAAGTNADEHYHGTHVAGTIAATGGNATGVVGVAPHAKLLDLRFLDEAGLGATSDAVQAVQLAAALRVSGGVDLRVINASWGGGGYSSALRAAIAAAGEAGILFVAAAGNDGINAATSYPCAYELDNVVCVGAITRSEAKASYSNFDATAVDLAAPGSSIVSTVPGASYGWLSGTSMATPHVAGTAALLAACGADVAATRTALLSGVDVVAGHDSYWATGGRLNAAQALTQAGCEPAAFGPPGAPSPAIVGAADQTISWTAGEADSFRVERADIGTGQWSAVAQDLTGTAADLSAVPEGRMDLRVIGIRVADGEEERSPAISPFIIDRTPPAGPTFAFDAAGAAAEATTWYPPGTTMTVSGADPQLADGSAGSGVVGFSVTVDTHGAFGAQQVADVAGNTSPAADPGASVDATAPAISVSGCPTLLVQGQPGSATVTATDVGSGLAVDPSGARTVPADVVGTRTATWTATDRVGLSATTSCTYQVEAAVTPEPTGGAGGGGTSTGGSTGGSSGGFGGGGFGGGGAAPVPTATPTPTPTPTPTSSPTPSPTPTPDGQEGLGGPAGPPPPRIDLSDPGAASLAVSQYRFATVSGFAGRLTRQVPSARTAAHAVVARDDAFADALAGAPLSGLGPLLLTDGASLEDGVAEELTRVLDPGGVVYLLGGEGALSPAVGEAVDQLGLQVRRLAGPTRIETSVEVAHEVLRVYGDRGQVLLARAFGAADNPSSAWADAISGGAYGAWAGVPVVLTPTDSLHPAPEAFVTGSGLSPVLLGGEAALSAEVAGGLPGGAHRVSAGDRAGTAVAAAEQLWGLPLPLARATVINGWHERGWAFGLTAAGLAADLEAPLLLVGAQLPPATSAAVGCTEVTVVGGQDSVSADIETLLNGRCTR